MLENDSLPGRKKAGTERVQQRKGLLQSPGRFLAHLYSMGVLASWAPRADYLAQAHVLHISLAS